MAHLYQDRGLYLRGLERLKDLLFNSMLPAHGEILDRMQGLEKIDASIEFVHIVDAYLRENEGTTLRGLAHAIGTQVGPYGGIGLQTAAVARAHRDHLVRQGSIAPRYYTTP